MRQRAARESSIAVSSFKHADDASICYLVCERACILCEAVVETDGDFATVTGHGLVLVFACVEATAAGGELMVSSQSEYLMLTEVPDEYQNVVRVAWFAFGGLLYKRRGPLEYPGVPFLVQFRPEVLFR